MKRPPIKTLPSREVLLEMFSYEPDAGVLKWNPREVRRREDKIFNGRFAGKEAGLVRTFRRNGVRYRMVNIQIAPFVKARQYQVHRVIWKIVTGEDPPEFIDHEDGDGANNKWSNLRPADNSKNLCNSKLRSDNSTGVKGVHLRVIGNYRRYRAVVSVNRTYHRLGEFKTLDEAAAVVAAARIRLHGDFARHN